MREFFPLFLFLLPIVRSHVALTFPEARFPPLDFLDTSRTTGPCGVPKPRMAHYTSLVIGSTYNFTWRMQYPHQGGYRLLLLDVNGEQVEQLAPVNGIEYAGMQDQTSQFERVRFTKPCHECTVVLERQALEWGKSYRFRSCADVNILETADESSICSGRGTFDGGNCNCDSGFTGDVCQYLANCARDDDCMNGGKCIREGNSLVQNTCYCSYGYFGKNCDQHYEHENDECFAYSEKNQKKFSSYGLFNPECYNKEQMNDKDFVYYRKVKSDIEIILDFESASWISLGWRPDALDPSCRLFPDLEGARAKRASVDMPPLRAMRDEVTPPSTAINRDDPPIKVAQAGPRPVMPKNNGLLDSALQAPLHAMDCLDIITGSIIDGRLRIMDMYSRDRSTPLEDSWYEGEMSLVATVGIEEDGRTIIMFRRWIQEIEPTDHPLGPGRVFAAWAKGQVQGAYTHSAPSALEKSNFSSDMNFYRDDVLKYHGSKNRGVHSFDFTAPVKYAKPGDAAFGVNIAQGDKVRISVEPTTQLPTTSQSEATRAKSTLTPKPSQRPKATEPDSANNLNSVILIAITVALYLL